MKVDFKTKFFYGMGFISVGIKDILYAVFIYIYVVINLRSKLKGM